MLISKIVNTYHSAFGVVLGIIKHLIEGEDWWYTAHRCNKSIYPNSKRYFVKVEISMFLKFLQNQNALFRLPFVTFLVMNSIFHIYNIATFMFETGIVSRSGWLMNLIVVH